MIGLTKFTKYFVVTLIIPIIFFASSAHAQSTNQDFSFSSFVGTYNLARDSSGVATLNVKEDMVVEFPLGSNLYGIKRAIPESYQGRSLGLKIISVTDESKNAVPYHAYPDGNGNMVVETGDPDITLSGLQSYIINYKTSGVAALYPDRDEFLVDVNGRGWQESFDSVKAYINVSKEFAASMISQPECYIGALNTNLSDCQVSSQNNSSGQLITASTTQKLGGQQALIVKLDFKKDTFKQKTSSTSMKLTVISVLVVVILCISSVFKAKYIKHNNLAKI